jgi:uncharacterized membrane protein
VNDKTELVLKSQGSTLFGIPNPVWGLALYTTLLVLVSLQYRAAAEALAVVGVLVSVYLGYSMVVRIRALCPTCVSIAALNVLILVQLVL